MERLGYKACLPIGLALDPKRSPPPGVGRGSDQREHLEDHVAEATLLNGQPGLTRTGRGEDGGWAAAGNHPWETQLAPRDDPQVLGWRSGRRRAIQSAQRLEPS